MQFQTWLFPLQRYRFKWSVKKLLCTILTFEKVYLLKLLLLLLDPHRCKKGSYKIGLVHLPVCMSVHPSVTHFSQQLFIRFI